MPPMEVLYRIRRQRPDVFERLEGNASCRLTATPRLDTDNVC
jgi:hypothetical protein